MGFFGSGAFEMTLVKTPLEIGIEVPEYVPLPANLPLAHYARVGQILHLSGHIPDSPGQPELRGRLGAELSVEDGRAAARRVALNLLSTLTHAAGDLDGVARIVKLVGFVASEDTFVDQPAVINAASEIFVALWGRNGLHARSAVGVAQLPFGVPVEIELIVELEAGR